MADAWYGALQSAGYKNLGVYSYTSYLQGPLNNSNIYAKTRWVAQYGAQMGYSAFGANDRGWQYTSSGRINGISGSVDMNAFGNKEFVAIYSQGTGYYIANSLDGGNANFSFGYGNPNDKMLVGDWNKNGKDSFAARRGNAYYIKNVLAGGDADRVVFYGRADDQVLVGDWDGDGRDTFAVRR